MTRVSAGDPGEAAPAAICIAGPTGTGKTELALRLAARFDVEIVSVDSAMVYRRMDVGTAKPDAALRRAVPHHLIDVREPWESYSAGEFRAGTTAMIIRPPLVDPGAIVADGRHDSPVTPCEDLQPGGTEKSR